MRELPLELSLATDACVSLRRYGVAAGGIHERLVVKVDTPVPEKKTAEAASFLIRQDDPGKCVYHCRILGDENAL